MQVPQLLVDPHAAGLELPVRAAAQPPGQPFECVAGIVDTDTYSAHIHFPFFATAPDGLYTVEKGTPLVQVIPLRRDGSALKAEIRAKTTDEARQTEKVYRNTIASEGWYRKVARALR